MQHIKNVVLGLCIAAGLPACDDDDANEQVPDSSVARDAGADASPVSSLDAGHDASIDAGSAADSAVAASDASSIGAKTYTLTLTTAAEVPPCELAGEAATGNATLTINAAADTIELNLTFSDLGSSAMNGHIHYGTEDEMGPPVMPFGPPFTSPIVRTFTAAQYKPLGNAPAGFADFVAELRAGRTYLNLHTLDCLSGEIRVQIK